MRIIVALLTMFVERMFLMNFCFLTDPLYSEIDATNLESVRKNVVFDNLFVDTPFQAKLRTAGVLRSLPRWLGDV
jgi:hypothetical protein